jgi:hypothetical protein
VDTILRDEVVEAGIRLRKAISRAVHEAPECFAHRNGKWSVEFRNPASGETIVVTYSGPTAMVDPVRLN